MNARWRCVIGVAVSDRLHHVVNGSVVGGRVERQHQRAATVGRDRSDSDAVVNQIAAFGQRAQESAFAEDVIAIGCTVANERQRRVFKRVFGAINVGVEDRRIGVQYNRRIIFHEGRVAIEIVERRLIVDRINRDCDRIGCFGLIGGKRGDFI